MAIDFPPNPIAGQSMIVGNVRFRWSATRGVWDTEPFGTALPQNYIINGSFQCSQQNADSGSAATGWYAADMWNASPNPAGIITTSRLEATTNRGSQYRLQAKVTTARPTLAAGEYHHMIGYVEGQRTSWQWGTINALPIVVRFGLRAPSGTYGFFIRNPGPTRSYVQAVTVAAGDNNVMKEYVFQVPGDTTGTWPVDNTNWTMGFSWGAGTTLSTPANTWTAGNFINVTGNTNGLATLNNTFLLEDVGVYFDPNSTGLPPPWEIESQMMSQLRSMRYWYRSYMLQGVCGAATSINRAGWRHPVSMRAGPAYAAVGGIAASSPSVGGAATLSTAYPNIHYAEMETTVTGTHTIGSPGTVSGSGSIYVAVNAR